jgi:lauroyl/myristoyl acyltransferase
MLSETDNEKQDLEQLCYLGLRGAFKAEYSREQLHAQARVCVEGKYKQLEFWIKGETDSEGFIPFENEQNLTDVLKSGRGAVVCSPHVGSYHFIPLELVKRKYAVTILLDTANFEKEKSNFEHWKKYFTGHEPLRYINAELPDALWKMSLDIKEGRILFIWLDGNTGLAARDNAKSLVEISFCGLRLSVRKGLAYLSAWSGAPILHALALPENFPSPAIRFDSPLRIKNNESKEEFCQRAMQEVWTRLETCVKNNPACWEEWYHLHLWERRDAQISLTEGYEVEQVLNLTLRKDEEAELLTLSQGTALVSLKTGAALLFTDILQAVFESCDGSKTVVQILDALNGKFDEITLLENLHALITGGFISIAEY